MSYLFITALSVPLAAVELPFNIFKLVFLIAWAYLCLYCVQKIFLNPTLSTPAKTFANLLAFFIGPVVLLIIFLVDIKRNSSETSTGFMESIREHFHSLTENLGKRRSQAPPISILDSSGRNITELYSHGERAQSQDRQILDLTQQIIYDAIVQDASDILIDPKDNSIYAARYRIDGVLHEVEQIDAAVCQALINSIKAVSNMDIAEKRRPQDGAFVAKTDGNSISFRVASAGVLNGEKLSIRVLNQDPNRYQLDSIGLTEKQQVNIMRALDAPSGMILLCGPTGSGKTTTMYAMLNKINLQTRNVITVEDPIEYVLPQASQMEVNEKAGITFAKSLRSMLRQDPDVICVGEIRDEETAQIALRAAQTGHLVLATIHSTSNASALIRLMDLGVTPAMLSTGLSLIIAQRLVRNLCENCKKPAELNARQVNEFRRRQIDCSMMFQPAGCAECHYSGYRGRTGIYDLLVIDETIKKNILNNEVALSQLRKEGSQRGKSSLRKQGMRKVVNGETSLQELMRVLGTGE
ncbi:MAG: GspE/PulE family protein [Phycisphaerae bacterium]|jgi:type II secretory ATPase GspE/PulE/Tfp pilus assembly ATPase PilB-like protein